MIDITMPSLGADMAEGTLIEWLVTIGDQVNKGDIIAVIETDKGAIDMEAYQSGKVSKIVVQPITKVPVGTVLARLESDSNSDPGSKTPTTKPKQQQQNKTLEEESDKQTQTEEIVSEKIVSEKIVSKKALPIDTLPEEIFPKKKSPKKASPLASPLVRKIAEDSQLDLSTIKGSGPGGAIILNDVVNDAANNSSEAVDGSKKIKKTSTQNNTDTNTNAMRTAIALAMEKSKREIPHYYLSLDIDISKTLQWLHTENKEREPDQRQLLLAVLLKAVANTLIKFPQLNGYYLNNQFQPSEGVHIGNAISLRKGGLVVPAIHHVETLSLDDVMRALRDVVNRSRGGRLRSSELSDATITVTNMGDLGSDTVFGIIYPPQVAIIGFGTPRKAPQVKDNALIVSHIITISLSADHRVSDGGLGAKFLNTFAHQLQKPESL